MTGDLLKGIGIEDALKGVKVMVHCASAASGDDPANQNLVRAMSAVDRSTHLVFTSIVGLERVSFGYTKAKLAAEQIVTRPGLPWTIQRATQFFDYASMEPKAWRGYP